jgi:zinc protease
MELSINSTENYSIASVKKPDSEIVKAIITVDTHQENSLELQAVHNLYSDMLLSGAGEYSREKFLHAVNMLGASIDIHVTDGKVTFILRGTATQFKKLLKLFSTLILEPSFPASELTRVKSVTTNVLHQAKEDSKTIAQNELRNLFYGKADRKYSYSINETMQALPKTSQADIKTFHSTVLNTKWCCTIAGNEAVIAALESCVKKIQSAGNTTQSSHKQKPAKPTLKLQNIPSRQNIDLSIGLPLPITRTHADYIPLAFAVAILGKWGGFAGRLMSTVREKEGLTYGIYGQLEGFTAQERGYFRIMTFFAPDKVVQGLNSTFREIRKLYTSGVSQAEVDAFRTILITQQTLTNDSLTRILSDFHGYHCEGYSVEEMKQHKKALHDVTKADINRVITEYLNPALISISGAGPTAGVQKELKEWFANVQ